MILVVLFSICFASILSFLVLRKLRLKIKKEARVLNRMIDNFKPDSRNERIQQLKQEVFDVLIIGGGATGSGCALDAATRGLRVALIERYDFGSETSSKSTKLLHGGIRYLEKAIMRFSLTQLLLVFQALSERWIILKMAPFLTRIIPIMVPIYQKYKMPYYWILLKLYDKMSMFKSLGRSYFLNRDDTVERFGRLAMTKLAGTIVYFDGSFDDSRMNILVSVTSAAHGAVISNYIRFDSFNHLKPDIIESANCTDLISGKEFKIKAKSFISAAGPFTDEIRKINNKQADRMMVASHGTHIVLPAHYCPHNMGLVDGKTADNRILFVLPWRDLTLVGSTDVVKELNVRPKPTIEDVEFLCRELQRYTTLLVSRRDVLAAWTGIRPLVRDLQASSSEGMVRSHKISKECQNLFVITGGKWTTFRKMAEETIDKVIGECSLEPKRGCVTRHIVLIGSNGYSRDLYYEIKEELGIDEMYAEHLLKHYGTRSRLFKKYIEKYNTRLTEKYLFRSADVVYCIDYEYACNISDILNGRFMVGYSDVREAYNMIRPIGKIMAEIFEWDAIKEELEVRSTIELLATLGLDIVQN